MIATKGNVPWKRPVCLAADPSQHGSEIDDHSRPHPEESVIRKDGI
jgi:hypothetical protein